jgi:hypothetical protein
MQDDNVWTGGNPIDWVDIMFIQDDSLSANLKFSFWLWREQINFQSDDDEVRFVLDQHA